MFFDFSVSHKERGKYLQINKVKFTWHNKISTSISSFYIVEWTYETKNINWLPHHLLSKATIRTVSCQSFVLVSRYNESSFWMVSLFADEANRLIGGVGNTGCPRRSVPVGIVCENLTRYNDYFDVVVFLVFFFCFIYWALLC